MWVPAPTPPAPASEGMLQPGVKAIRFADDLDGWAFGSSLWSTHDGGATWHAVTIPGVPADSTVALEAAGGVATLIADAGKPLGGPEIATSPVTEDAWHVTGPGVGLGAGPANQPILVLAGGAGWFIQNDRTVIGGARRVGGTWQAWQPPCLDANGPALLAAATPAVVVAECDAGVWGPAGAGTLAGDHLYRSTDGGRTFAVVPQSLPLDLITTVAMPDASEIDIAGAVGTRSAIAASTDGGRSWRITYRGLPNEDVSYLGFTTPTQGVAISGRRLLMTRDGGQSWSPVSL
jgi:photosystem II stability/assembly factor-like uncharacterized protein